MEQARRIFGALSLSDVLAQSCRELLAESGLDAAYAGLSFSGREWKDGVHVALDRAGPMPVTPRVLSATFALQRRLAARRHRPLTLTVDDETTAIFFGLSTMSSESGRGAHFRALHAFPLVRHGRVAGVALVAASDLGRVEAFDISVLEPLVSCVSAALDNALKLFAAKRDQERLLLLGEASADAFWDADLVTGEVWWSGALYGTIGGSLSETARGKLARVHPDDVAAVERSLQRAIAAPDATWTMEYRFRRTDGTWATVIDRAYFLRETNGSAYRVIGSLHDVTEERRAARQQRFLVDATALLSKPDDLQRSLQNVAELAAREIATACEIVLTTRGKPSYVARARVDVPPPPAERPAGPPTGTPAEPPTGTPAEPPTGKSAEPPTDKPAEPPTDAPADSAIGHGAPLLARLCCGPDELLLSAPSFHGAAELASSAEQAQLARALGLASWIAAPLSVDRESAGVLVLAAAPEAGTLTAGSLEFVSELARRCAIAIENARHLQAAREAARIREEFLAIASHELRTPLTPLLLQVDLLREQVPSFTVPEKSAWMVKKLETVRRQGHRLQRLVEELLDISRLAAGVLRLKPETVDLEAVVRGVARELAEGPNMPPVRIHVSGQAVGLWDRMRIEQIAINLLANAAKYGRGRPIDAMIRVEGKTATLAVRDEGIGIAPEDQERIFERFERAVGGSEFGGFGIGLFIVREIAQAMGGVVRVESRIGEGSTFFVELPLAPREKQSG